MEDPYLNDRLNYILLNQKKHENKRLGFRESRELKRLTKMGLIVTDDGYYNKYIKILEEKDYLEFTDLKQDKFGQVIGTRLKITNSGIKALKYKLLKSESRKEKNSTVLHWLQKMALIITILATLISLSISIKSCKNNQKIDDLEKRINTIEKVK
jgi:hypothetical protein